MADKLVEGILYDLGLLNEEGEASGADRKAVIRYLNEGRCLIASLNPSFYGERKTYKLEPGNVQQFCKCESVTEIVGQSKDDTCSIIRRFEFPQKWGCEPDFPFTIDRAIIDENDGIVHVEPPVPDDIDVFLTIKCLPKIDDIDDDTVSNCKDGAALTQWVLYRATLADGSDENALSLAQLHLSTFSDLTQITMSILQAKLRTEILKQKLGDK